MADKSSASMEKRPSIIRGGAVEPVIKYEFPTGSAPEHVPLPENKGTVVVVKPELITHAVREMCIEANRFAHPLFLEALREIAMREDSSPMDRWVAEQLIENAVVAAKKEGFPLCQDTGQVICVIRRGNRVVLDGETGYEAAVNEGVSQAYTDPNAALRKSMVLRQPMRPGQERGTAEDNAPASIIYEEHEDPEGLEITVMPKGGGSQNVTKLIMEVPTNDAFATVVRTITEQISAKGCPPYSIGIAIGEDPVNVQHEALRNAYDFAGVRMQGNEETTEFAGRVLDELQSSGIGAQFGGRGLAWNVVFTAPPSHIATMPIGITIVCAAARKMTLSITPEGATITQLEHSPENFIPEPSELARGKEPNELNLQDTSPENLSMVHAGDLVNMNGIMFIARDIAHQRLIKAMDAGEELPFEITGSTIFYAGPAETPQGCASGSCGPTTSSRMDEFFEKMAVAGMKVCVGKGPRSAKVAELCKQHGIVYVGMIGGAAASAAQHIKSAEVIAYPDLGAEAVRKIEVEGMQGVVIIDAQGNDFYRDLKKK